MKKTILLTTLLAVTFLQAESPTTTTEVISITDTEHEVIICPPGEEIDEITVTDLKPNDYSVSLLNGGGIDFCKGAVVAPSWVMTAKHCATTGLKYVTDKKRKHKVKVHKKFRIEGADFALLKVKKGSFAEDKALPLLSDTLKRAYGNIDFKKITHNSRRGTPAIYINLVLKGTSKKLLYAIKRAGKAGSSGSPWVVNTQVGDVAVAVTHGGGRGVQTSYAKKWVDKVLLNNTPEESIKWIGIDTVLDGQ
ncbi:MAG: trypsin-like serine protease [Campylobacterota bacterium]|nr:trypsin-like serine protease [Campylobacterota bacterium]